MTLNQKQLDILQAIQKGCQSDTQISKRLGFDMALVGHYLDEMKKEGYVEFNDIERLGETKHREFIELTDKGKVAVNYPDDLISEEKSNMNSINFNAPIHAPIGVLQNSDGNTVNITQNNNQNIQEIINILELLEKEIQVFPEEEKQDALVYLDQLKTEIKGDQNPAKIRTFFKGFMKIVIPLASLIVNGADFANNATDLATKLVTYFNVDISHIALPFQ
jgi:predicted transcriptional regulator